MIDPEATRFWQVARQSGLMDAEGLAACWQAIAPEKRDVLEHVERRLARQAVQTKRLTLWQAQQLLAGRTSGFKIDRYVLLDLIGQGGMGRVYLALDTRLDRRVALKILAPDRVSNPRSVKRFEREARVGAQLQHENLVRIYDSGHGHGRLYLVMEYIEGKTIGTLISEQGPMPPATAARLVRQTALGLEQMYRKGMIHRDVNPYNIIVTHDGTAKLADLGLAMKLDENNQVTRDGATVGTFDYVSPEQARHSHSADIRSDIYSLGCTMYHMVSGRVPFPGGSLPEKLYAHQAVEPQPLAELVPEIPEGLVEIICRMMRKKPEERYETPLELAHDLERYAEYVPPSGNVAGTASQAGPGSAAPTDRPSFIAGDGTAVSSGGELESDRLPRQAAPEPVEYASAHAGGKSANFSPTLSPRIADSGLDTGMELPVIEPGPVTPESEPGPEPEWSMLFNTFPSAYEPVLSRAATTRKRTAGAFWIRRRREVTLAALIIVAALASVMGIIMTGWRTTGPSPAGSRPTSNVGSSIFAGGSTTKQGAASGKTPDFVVRFKDEDRVPETDHSETLLDAVERAMGGDGYVELTGVKPIILKADQSLDFNTGRPLVLRAATGVAPVIEVEMTNRTKPVISPGSSSQLTLLGIRFLAKYTGAEGKFTVPLIKTSGGPVHIDKCAFEVDAAGTITGSCAIETDGGSLMVDRSWFQNFGTAIRYSAYAGSIATVERSMIVSEPKFDGWAIEVKVMSAADRQGLRRLKLQHNTFDGIGLLDLSNGVSAPIQVEIKRCAARAEALLAWTPQKGAVNKQVPSSQVQWEGENNLYQVIGQHWILLSPRGERTPAFQLDVADLDSWQRMFTKEIAPVRGTFQYATDGKPHAGMKLPRDFDLEGEAGRQAGASSREVGPGSR